MNKRFRLFFGGVGLLLICFILNTCLVWLVFRADAREQYTAPIAGEAGSELLAGRTCSSNCSASISYPQTTIPLSASVLETIQNECTKWADENQSDGTSYHAEGAGVTVPLILAIIETESRGDVLAESEHCVGLMQLHKAYASTFLETSGVATITEPEDNVICGIGWFAQLCRKYDDIELVLMAYNLGEQRALSLWQSGIRSTAYTHEVLSNLQYFCKYEGVTQ